MPSRQRTPAHNLKISRKGEVKKRNVLWRWRRGLFLCGVLAVTAFAGVAWVITQVDLPPAAPPQSQTSFICLAEVTQNCNQTNAVESLHGAVNRVEITRLSQVPKMVQDAVLAAEDKNFFRHGGIDPAGIARAAWNDLTSRSQSQGGSTITQQYVRNAYLTQKRTWTRKIKEAVLAVKIEQKLPKKEIFRRYLNTVYFGRGAYGIQAAAAAYFGVDVSRLNLPQAAFLAAIIRSPDTDPWRSSALRARALELRHFVLRDMARAHFITPAQYAFADKVPLDATQGLLPPQHDDNGVSWLGGPFGSDESADSGAQYFVDYVRRQLISLVGSREAYSGGLRVYTTLDPHTQQLAYQSVTNVLHNLPFSPQPEAGLVSIDNSGHVVAMVSGDKPFGSGNGRSQVNLTTGRLGGGAGRQPGSTFKAFALAETMKEGYSLYSQAYAPAVADYPYYIHNDGTYIPVSSDRAGSFNLIDATAQSINNIYMPLIHQLGADKVANLAFQMGIQRNNSNLFDAQGHVSEGIVLGSGEVAPIDMASAYSTFMDNGAHIAPTAIARIEDNSGHVIWQAPNQQTQVLTSDQNGRVVYALQQVLVSGTAAGKGLGYDAAGKTGTTNDSADAWFVGFTPSQLTTAVWMGYPDSNKSMPGVYGGDYPTDIWHDFMTAALSNQPHPSFPQVDLSSGNYLNLPTPQSAYSSQTGSYGYTSPPTTAAGSHTYTSPPTTGSDTNASPTTTPTG